MSEQRIKTTSYGVQSLKQIQFKNVEDALIKIRPIIEAHEEATAKDKPII